MGKDTARMKWSLPTRRSNTPPRRTTPATPPPPPPSASSPVTNPPPTPILTVPTTADRPQAMPPTSPPWPGRTWPPSSAASSALPDSASGGLAGRTGLSASYLSRLMSGERFPAWKHVAALARACGADPEVLRQVWRNSNARRDSQPRPASLASALRFLHLRAGSPTHWAIAVSSGNELHQDHTTALLNGTATGDREDVQRLVQILDGEPAYFLPLWEAEAEARPATQPDSTAQRPPSARATESPPPASTRVEELSAAFKDALGSPRLTPPSLPPNPPVPRHPYPRRHPLDRPLTPLSGHHPLVSPWSAKRHRMRRAALQFQQSNSNFSTRSASTPMRLRPQATSVGDPEVDTGACFGFPARTSRSAD
ncbi:helix-turn-helix domain-containing protein [Streptomyces bluensis]|uniref:Helix-turn-helix domain-containing protein n=1 Tax=Streptomyces bluensis TaxID=33897 RepID=A0ABW6UB16_9ACTN